jgi:hypothetical protein
MNYEGCREISKQTINHQKKPDGTVSLNACLNIQIFNSLKLKTWQNLSRTKYRNSFKGQHRTFNKFQNFHFIYSINLRKCTPTIKHTYIHKTLTMNRNNWFENLDVGCIWDYFITSVILCQNYIINWNFLAMMQSVVWDNSMCMKIL